jgi:thiol-disulfide isomerase/thioredoxin
VDFTGSDWCGWCIKLDKEVFSQQPFLDYAHQEFVLVALDYPHGEEAKAAVPNPERNKALSNQYKIRGFPTILLMTPDGEVYAQTGYQAGGPEKYVEHLKELKTTGMKAVADVRRLTQALADAKGAAKEPIYAEAIEALGGMEPGSPASIKLAEAVRGALEYDASGKLGLKLRAIKALLVSGNGDEEVFDAARAMDPKNAEGLLEQVVMAVVEQVDSEEKVVAACKEIAALDAAGPIKNEETALRLYFQAADWNERFVKDSEAAKRFAAKAKPLVKDPRMSGRLDEILNG